MPAPQIRTYILVIGRDQDDQPYRAVTPYYVPMPGLTDTYEQMTNTQIRQAARAVDAERRLLEEAASDLEAESYRRLEAMK